MTSQAVIKCLEEYSSIFRLPTKNISDVGSCFKGKAFQEYLAGRHILHDYMSSHHPSSNGLIEHRVRSLKDVLKKVQGPMTKAMINDLTFKLSNHMSYAKGSPPMLFLGRSFQSRLPNSMKRSVNRNDLVKQRMIK